MDPTDEDNDRPTFARPDHVRPPSVNAGPAPLAAALAAATVDGGSGGSELPPIGDSGAPTIPPASVAYQEPLRELPGDADLGQSLSSRPPEQPVELPPWINVVSVVSPKGGCGKTTLSLHLATAAAKSEFEVLIVDLDPNGDILNALGAQVERGVYDLLAGFEAKDAIRSTAIDGLYILPARGTSTPISALGRPFEANELKRVLANLNFHASLVILDCPAGMFGATSAAMRTATEVVAVLQASALASRSLDVLTSALSQEGVAPLAGTVVNMFSALSEVSAAAIDRLDEDLHRPISTPVPFSPVIPEAAHRGRPVHEIPEGTQMAWIFDKIAEEILSRLDLQDEDDDFGLQELTPFVK